APDRQQPRSPAAPDRQPLAAARPEPAAPPRVERRSLYDDPDAPSLDSGLEDHDDDAESAVAPGEDTTPASPLAGLSDAELERRLRDDPGSLGSLSIGTPNAGALVNGVRLPESPLWELEDPGDTWGTRETIEAITSAVEAVNGEFPNTPPLAIGHVSAKRGGPLAPHVSHQAGRDVDLGFYYLNGARWYARATADNLDRARTWALVRALVTRSDVELILVDHSVRTLLEEHAERIGEDRAWLDSLFHGEPGKTRPLIFHWRGHATHLHVRFYSPLAREGGRRAYRALVARGLVRPPVTYLSHVAKRGETLGMLARKYQTTVAALREANELRGTRIIAGHTYRIPRTGGAAAPRRVVVPPRRLPPPR
ncbi:MAG: penicillin-insensitive murein endopeptidase, partial [Sorangiineae bacterium]|nr:penicillin-insensitive murein endopeptidase [Sorangiineae bacterium]